MVAPSGVTTPRTEIPGAWPTESAPGRARSDVACRSGTGTVNVGADLHARRIEEHDGDMHQPFTRQSATPTDEMAPQRGQRSLRRSGEQSTGVRAAHRMREVSPGEARERGIIDCLVWWGCFFGLRVLRVSCLRWFLRFFFFFFFLAPFARDRAPRRRKGRALASQPGKSTAVCATRASRSRATRPSSRRRALPPCSFPSNTTGHRLVALTLAIGTTGARPRRRREAGTRTAPQGGRPCCDGDPSSRARCPLPARVGGPVGAALGR